LILVLENCKLKIANCKLQIGRAAPRRFFNLQFAICNLQFAILGILTATLACSAPAAVKDPLPYGMEGLNIPKAVEKNATSSRTVELLAQAAAASDASVTRRVQLVRDIGACKLSAGLKYVETAMGDPDPLVRGTAAQAAAVIGDASATKPLQKLLADPEPEVRREAILAGATLGDPSFAAAGLKETDELVLRGALNAASTPEHAKQIAARFDGLSPMLKTSALDALGRIGDASQASIAAGQLGGSIPHKVAAIRALGQMKATAQVERVLKMLGDPHPTVRREAVDALSGVASVEVQQQQAIAMLGDEDRSVRHSAAKLLGAVPTADAVDALVKQLYEDYRPLHKAARDALVATGDPSVPAAVKLLDDSDARRREDGSYVLGKLKSDSGLERHIALMDDKDWGVVTQVANSLGEIGRKEAIPPLAKLAARGPTLRDEVKDPKDYGAYSACEQSIVACGKLGHSAILPAIKPLIPFDEFQSGALRGAAVYAFGLLGDASDPTCATMMGLYPNPKEGENVKFESFKAAGHLNYKPALGLFSKWDSEQMISSSPNLRWIAHWSYERISGQTVPYTPPETSWTPDVAISDLPQ